MVKQVLTFSQLDGNKKHAVVSLYNKKWACTELLKKAQIKTQTSPAKALEELKTLSGICKNLDYFELMSYFFPEGQLVLVEDNEVKAALTTVAGFINLDTLKYLPANYEKLSDYRNVYLFRNLVRRSEKDMPVIYCISIIGENDSAAILLNEIRALGREYNCLIMPYSAPRSLRFYYDEKPEKKEVIRYLSLTKKMKSQELEQWEKTKSEILSKIYDRFFEMPPNIFYYSDFAKWFSDKYGREPTLRDFMIYFNERPFDFTLWFHMQKGANLFYHDGNPVVIEDSRKEDVMAHGYNMLLIYNI
jgi:hypothetical protein